MSGQRDDALNRPERDPTQYVFAAKAGVHVRHPSSFSELLARLEFRRLAPVQVPQCDHGARAGDVEVWLSILTSLIGVVGVRPSPALAGAVVNAVLPVLPPGTTYELDTGFVKVHTPQRDAAVSGLSPRWPIASRWSKVMQARTLTQALLTHVAAREECPARGARLSVRPSGEGIVLDLTNPLADQLVLQTTLAWSDIE